MMKWRRTLQPFSNITSASQASVLSDKHPKLWVLDGEGMLDVIKSFMRNSPIVSQYLHILRAAYDHGKQSGNDQCHRVSSISIHGTAEV